MIRLYLLVIVIFIISCSVYSQNQLGKSDDAARLPIVAHVPKQFGNLTPKAQKTLKTRLEKIIARNGLGSSSFDQRFILTAKIDEMDKDFVAGTPPIYNYELEVTLIIGDAVEGTIFSTHTIEVRGAGNTETYAYLDAIKKIKPTNREYQLFIEQAKNKIIEYYNSQCDFIFKEADMLVNQNEFDAAISKLVSIPEVCKECYDEAMDKVGPIYQQKIDHQCKIDLAEAKNAWNANKNGFGANQASRFLGRIDPNSSCYDEALGLSNSIANRIDELEQREWDFKMKQRQDEVDVRKAEIESAKAIGIAYGQNQPQNLQYNYKGWW